MDYVLGGLAGFGLGISYLIEIRKKISRGMNKDICRLIMSILVLVPCFIFIYLGNSKVECFTLISLIVGHYFGHQAGREVGRAESRNEGCQ